MTELEQDQFNALLLQNERLKEWQDIATARLKEIGDLNFEKQQIQADKVELLDLLRELDDYVNHDSIVSEKIDKVLAKYL